VYESGHQPIGEVLASGVFEGADLHHPGVGIEQSVSIG
jgi:hypothetical protein